MPKTKKKTSKRKPNPAFMRPVQPDDKLAAIVGSQPLPRSKLTKKLWNYIKKHGCQDKNFFFQAEDGIRDGRVTGVQTCALPILAFENAGGKGVNGEFDLLFHLDTAHIGLGYIGVDLHLRSEERRVGKECRSRWWSYR